MDKFGVNLIFHLTNQILKGGVEQEIILIPGRSYFFAIIISILLYLKFNINKI